MDRSFELSGKGFKKLQLGFVLIWVIFFTPLGSSAQQGDIFSVEHNGTPLFTINATSKTGMIDNVVAENVVVTDTLQATNFFPRLAVIQDVKPPGTDGGDFPGSTWIVRDLGTCLVDKIGVVLINNIIALPVGTYYCRGSAPAYNVERHKAALALINGTILLHGTSEISPISSQVQTRSFIIGVFTIQAGQQIHLQLSCEATATNGLGRASSDGGNPDFTEIYSVLELQKLE